MNTRYTYASARVKTLETSLLSETQIERLFGAKTIPEAYKVLEDTFLAPYLTEHEHTPLGPALDKVIADTKHTLDTIAPDPELLSVLWLKYDFYNLRTIIKGVRAGKSREDTEALCFNAGRYSFDELMGAYENGRLANLNLHLAQAAEKAQSAEEVYGIDLAANEAYFKAIQEIAFHKNDPFVDGFVKLQIDLFNLKTALRATKLKEAGIPTLFIPGGRFRAHDLETEKQVLDAFAQIGGEEQWREAIEEYTNTGDFSIVEKTADEIVLAYVKERNYTLFSPAPLFAFFTGRKNNVQLIAGVIAEKEAGLTEGEIRHIFRTPYK